MRFGPSGKLTPRRGLGVLCTILFLTFLDNTIVSVVLIGVQNDLRAGVQQLQWIVNGYMLAFAALMLAGGSLGDIWGRKRVMLGGVGLFTLGSLIALVAPTTGALTTGRVIMGIGAAASEPGTLSLIRHLFPKATPRHRAFGTWAAVSGAALALGPIIGGLIISASGWRGVFGFNIALGLVTLLAGIWLLPESSDPAGRSLDWRGLLSGAAAIVAVTFALTQGESVGYGRWWIDALFAFSVIALLAFIKIEQRAADPVLKLAFFRRPYFFGANLVAFATNFAVFAIFFFTALYLQLIASYSGYKIALAFLSMALTMVIAAPLASRWVSWHGPLVPTTLGCLLSGGGMFLVDALLYPKVGLASLAGALGLIGLGFGMTLVTATSTVLNLVAPERSGMAASTVNTSRELGGVLGVAILGALVNGQLTTSLANRLHAIGLPADFQSLVIYAITHGGTTPPNAHVSAATVLAHPQLVEQVTQTAYAAFGHGLSIALRLAGTFLLVAGAVSWVAFRRADRPDELLASTKAKPAQPPSFKPKRA